LKSIFDTDFEYRLKPLETEIDTGTEIEIGKIQNLLSKPKTKSEKINTDIRKKYLRFQAPVYEIDHV